MQCLIERSKELSLCFFNNHSTVVFLNLANCKKSIHHHEIKLRSMLSPCSGHAQSMLSPCLSPCSVHAQSVHVSVHTQSHAQSMIQENHSIYLFFWTISAVTKTRTGLGLDWRWTAEQPFLISDRYYRSSLLTGACT